MGPKEREEALATLRTAMELEKKSYEFYQEAATRTLDPKGKAMFGRLAQDEIEHERKLQMQYEAIQQTGDWLEYAEAPLAKIYKIRGRPQISASEDKARHATELDALRIAMEKEKAAYALFLQMSEETPSPTATKVFRLLAAEEDSHYLLLEAEYDNLTNTGFWFGYQEFTMEHA